MKLAFTLVVVGALNWGLIGAMDYNLVNSLLGQWEVVERVVYVLVGLSGLFVMVNPCMKCKKK
ncbi:MAG: uncharacterized membrane protein YuzA (DUF378 family) [Oceanicoccus sp.]|jgi:uncharacterized membrane protein YuzA (DUF378 family)